MLATEYRQQKNLLPNSPDRSKPQPSPVIHPEYGFPQQSNTQGYLNSQQQQYGTNIQNQNGFGQPTALGGSSSQQNGISSAKGVQRVLQGKTNLALTGELALGRNIPNYATEKVNGRQNQMNQEDTMNNNRGMSGGSTQPVYTQKQTTLLQSKGASMSDIAQAQSSLRLLKQKMQRNETVNSQQGSKILDLFNDIDEKNQNKIEKNRNNSRGDNEGNNNYRKVFKIENNPEESSNSNSNKKNNEFSQPLRTNNTETNGKQGWESQKEHMQAIQKLHEIQKDQLKMQYQSSMQKQIEKQDPQMMYNAQRFNQMQNYEYKQAEGTDDDEDFQFASNMKKKIKPPVQPNKKKQAEVLINKNSQDNRGVNNKNTKSENIRNNIVDEDINDRENNNNAPKQNPSKIPPKLKGNNNNNKNEINQSIQEEQKKSAAYRGEVDGKKYFNFNSNNNYRQEEEKEVVVESVTHQKFKPNLKPKQEQQKQISQPPKQPQPTNNNQPLPDEYQSPGDLQECPEGCGRKFASEALERHAKICKKVFQQKRKKFDARGQRQADDDQEYGGEEDEYYKKTAQNKKSNANSNANANKANAKAKWKLQSEQFRAVLQNIKTGEKGALPSDPALDDRVLCNHCGRKFNEQTLQKHEPLCGNRARIAKASGKPFGKK